MQGKAHVTILTCQTTEEYLRTCLDCRRRSTDIPLLDAAGTWPVSLLIGSDGRIALESCNNYFPAPLPDELASSRLSEAGQIDSETLRRFAARLRSDSGRSVLATDGTASYPAAVLALALGAQLSVVPVGAVLERGRRLLPNGPVIVVTSLEEADDDLMFGLLDWLQGALDSECSWNSLPQFSLVTGRDLSSLSWVVAKIAVAALGGAKSGHPSIRLASLTGYDESCTITEFHKKGLDVEYGRRKASYLETKDALASPASAVAHGGHGRDACSNTGSGVWLCGRRSSVKPVSVPGRAVLA